MRYQPTSVSPAAWRSFITGLEFNQTVVRATTLCGIGAVAEVAGG
jgi:hypothetical protein